MQKSVGLKNVISSNSFYIINDGFINLGSFGHTDGQDAVSQPSSLLEM